MNKKAIIIAAVAVLLGLMAGRYLMPAGSNASDADGSVAAESVDSFADETIWTCSMHPQIRQTEPGDCPICGMDLIPLTQDDHVSDNPRAMSMSESSRALAEIETTEVIRRFPEVAVRLVGELEYDETREKALTARFPARIDQLFVNFTGVRVKKGEHLAKIYSPDLLTAQRELLTAYRRDPASSITQAAKEKLRLWDLLPDQIDAIVESGEATSEFVLRAPIGGVVVYKKVKEGDYIQTGETLFKIVDLSVLWLYLDAYESDLTWLRYGQNVSFTVQAFPGEAFEGRIAFINPEVNRQTRTTQVRVNVPNEDGRLKPGMFARGIVSAKMADGGQVVAPELAGKWISPMHPEIIKDGPGDCDVCGMALVPAEELGYVQEISDEPPLVVPASSVLRTGKRSVVYVQDLTAENPTYEGREITLGPRAGDQFVVMEGLEAGEFVVSNGAFKIDSALQIQAKPSMMNPEGGGSPRGHDHADMPMDMGDREPQLTIPGTMAKKLLPDYLKLQAMLANDDLNGAKKALISMAVTTGHLGPLPELIREMMAADSLEAIRKPGFDQLSAAMINAIKADPTASSGELLIMHCPMVYGDTGADWLQASEPLKNPYFGAMMLKCGEVKETIGGDAKDAN
ncbi:MAG: efflux RND transporter periplasmic adaptor subunit [Verrucomicrobiota bacterium]